MPITDIDYINLVNIQGPGKIDKAKQGLLLLKSKMTSQETFSQVPRFGKPIVKSKDSSNTFRKTFKPNLGPKEPETQPEFEEVKRPFNIKPKAFTSSKGTLIIYFVISFKKLVYNDHYSQNENF